MKANRNRPTLDDSNQKQDSNSGAPDIVKSTGPVDTKINSNKLFLDKYLYPIDGVNSHADTRQKLSWAP